MTDLDRNDKQLILAGTRSLKSESCVPYSRLGMYLENSLPAAERAEIEGHLDRCLFCLDQATEIRELIYLERSGQPLSADQAARYRRALFDKNQKEVRPAREAEKRSPSSVQRAGSGLFPSLQFRYGISVAFVMLVITLASMVITIRLKNPGAFLTGANPVLTAEAEKNIRQSGVKVELMDSSGKTIETIPGLVIDSKGLILTNLKDMKNAVSARVSFKDGNFLPVEGVQPDETRNLAVLKVNLKPLIPAKISRPSRLEVGERYIHIADPTDPASTASHVTITRIAGGTHNDQNERRYIQVTGQHPLGHRGILVNSAGEAIGKIVSGEGMTGSAVTFESDETFAPSGNFIPVSLVGR